MIARIRGTLVARRPDHVVVDTGGVGYRVFVSLGSFCDLPDPGREVILLTHTVVREDLIHLYGFLHEKEWTAFARLTSVKGIGPKLALAILSALRPDDLWAAVAAADAGRLAKVPGVGKKTAARLVLELEGRLPEREEADAPLAAPPGSVAADAASALTNLGYPDKTAQEAVRRALDEAPAGASLEEVLRLALKRMD